MPYITYMQSPKYHQITFDEVLFGNASHSGVITMNETNTRTRFIPQLTETFLSRFDIEAMVFALEQFCAQNEALYEPKRASLYDTFYIPKRTGGVRTINAPKPALMTALRNLKTLFETQMFALYHTSAYAYVPHRSTIDSLKRHQQNDSRWFLKTDFSDFFGSTTPGFLLRMLGMIFPFCEIIKDPRGREALKKALDLCFLNGGLPQGTPISPMLTNLMMIPIDHRLFNCLRDYKGRHYIYTRYADDILISCRKNFDKDEVLRFMNDTLEEFRAPFRIKDEKTRYGSRTGSNWNLGLMLNKDNEITIGQKNKQRFRAMVCSYILDRRNGKPWELHDIQVLRGLTNYYHMVEPDYVDSVIRFNEEKYGVNAIDAMSTELGYRGLVPLT